MLSHLYKKEDNQRNTAFLGAILVLFLILVLRLVFLQVIQGSHYHALAEGNRTREMPIQATRGVIMDRNGQILAGSRAVYMVTYTPQKGGMPAEEVKRLCALLHLTEAELKERIEKHGNYVGGAMIASDIGQDVIAKIEEYRDAYPGINIIVQPQRYYLHGDLLANVLGYIGEVNDQDRNADGTVPEVGTIVGRAGLELYYDDYLRGKNGARRVEVDATGRTVKEIASRAITPGYNLRLTIDLGLQEAMEEAIRNQLATLAQGNVWPTGVAAVALDPNTGAVLAMSSWPTFQPNHFAQGISDQEWKALNESTLRPFDNRAITGIYPPGSLFKVVTGISALENKVVTPDERIYDEGRHWLIDKHNAAGEAFGWINFYEAMAKSDNVYFYEMGNRLGIDRIEDTARRLGLGVATGIDLYGESEGLVASEQYKKETFGEDWYLGETFDAAIGQSFHLATPLQMAVLFSEVANGGTRYRPYIVSRIDDESGNPYRIYTPEVRAQVTISKNVLDVVRESLRQVAQKDGTAGLLFQGYPIAIAAKTATAETGNGRDHGWFAAYAPFDHPQIVVVVIVEHGGYGIDSAAPIAKHILDHYFRMSPSQKKG